MRTFGGTTNTTYVMFFTLCVGLALSAVLLRPGTDVAYSVSIALITVVAGIALAATIAKPAWVVLSLLIFLSVQRQDLGLNLAFGSMRPSELLSVVSILVVLGHNIVGRRATLPRDVARATQFILLFLFVAFASSFMSFNIGNVSFLFVAVRRSLREQPFIKSYTSILSFMFGIATFYAVSLVLRGRLLISGIKFWVIGAVFGSIAGIYGFFANTYNLPLNDWIGVGTRGIDGTEITTYYLLPRIQGFTLEPRHLAIYLATVLPFLLIITLYRVHLFKPFVQWMSLVITGTAFIMTFSRSTLVLAACILGISALTLLKVKGSSVSVRQAILVAIIIVVVFALSNVALMSLNLVSLWDLAALQYASLFDSQNYSNWQATASLTVAMKAFLDYPVLGVGVGNLSFYVDRYIPAWSLAGRSSSQFTIPAIANNIYVEIAAEMGIIGLICFGLLVTYFARNALRAVRICPPGPWRILVIGLLASYLIMLIAFSMLSAFFFSYVWALTGLLHNVTAEIKNKAIYVGNRGSEFVGRS
jgi:O-antigen ligase